MPAGDLLEADAVRAFAVFAEHRNFTTAASALRISQPSLHVKIRKLGEALGIELYQRVGRQLELTPAGQRLAVFAEEARRRAADFVGELTTEPGPVRIAAGRGSLRWVISPAVQAIIRSGREVQLITADREAALRGVVNGSADVAVIALDPPPRTVRSRRIATFPQLLVIGARHPLAGRAQLHLTDLAGLGLLVPPAGRPHRQALDRALAEAGVAWRVAAEVDGWDLMVHFAALGLGAAVVNGCVKLPARLRGVPIVDLPPVRYWAAWRAARQPALAGVLEHL
jgi:LysR family transcriptional regulator, low CO2-responsive transcriptional regulator